jgi:nickel-type superoxide dismutase maturation protease
MNTELREANEADEIAFKDGLREVFRVEGDSMTPVLRSGDLVLVNSHAEIGIGDIVVARHPFKQSVTIIKRVAEILAGERYFLLSDNSKESADSRQFGAILRKDILGKAEARIKPEKKISRG